MRIVALFLGLCTSFTLYSQDARQIVEKYSKKIKATADESRYTTMYLTGEFCYQGICFQGKVNYKAPNLSRFEMYFQNVTFLQITNDSMRWELNPLDKTSTILKVTPEQLEEEKRLFFISDDLIHFKERGYKVKLLKKEKLDSLETFSIELEKGPEDKTLFNINTTSYLINRVVRKGEERIFGNYLLTGDLYYPRYMVEIKDKLNVSMTFREIVYDQSIPDSLFMIPEEEIAKAENADENTPKYFFDQAEKFYERDSYDSAINLYNEAISRDPYFEGAFNKRGLSKMETEDYYGAISDFTRTLEIDPKNSVAYNNRGLTKYYLKDYESALIDLKKSIELNPALSVAHQNQGRVLFSLGRYEEAVKSFSEALQLSPQSGLNHFNRGASLAQLEKYEEALSDYRKALRLDYATDRLFNYKGISEYKLEHYDSAILSFSKCIIYNSSNATYFENRARSHYELEDYKKAILDFEESIKLTPKNASLHNMKGLCHYFLENHEGAIESYSEAITLNPKEAVYFDNRALAREALEDYMGALSDYDESIKLYPNDASTFYKRGMIKILTSKKYEGCLDLATANEMEYEEAKDAILKNCH